MNTTVKAFLGIGLAAVAAVAILFGGGLMPGHLLGAGSGDGAGFEFGGYLILMLVNVGLGTIVAWMLFGTRE